MKVVECTLIDLPSSSTITQNQTNLIDSDRNAASSNTHIHHLSYQMDTFLILPHFAPRRKVFWMTVIKSIVLFHSDLIKYVHAFSSH